MQFVRRIFGSSPSKRPASGRRSSVRLEIENLEQRELLSATAAVMWPGGQSGEMYAIDASTRQEIDYHMDAGTSYYTKTYLGGPQMMAVAAAVDDPRDGRPEVFGLATDHSIWIHDDFHVGWFEIFGPSQYGPTAISATYDGTIFALNGNHVYVNSNPDNPDAWQDAGGYYMPTDAQGRLLTYFQSISASFTPSGAPEVFALGSDGGIYVGIGTNDTGYWQVVDRSRTFTMIAASEGNSVYAMDNTDQLFGEHEYARWTPLGHYSYWQGQSLGAPPISGSIAQMSVGTNANGVDKIVLVDRYYDWNAGQFRSVAYSNVGGSWNQFDGFGGQYVNDVAMADNGWAFDVLDGHVHNQSTVGTYDYFWTDYSSTVL
jgi:hypothetical protein